MDTRDFQNLGSKPTNAQTGKKNMKESRYKMFCLVVVKFKDQQPGWCSNCDIYKWVEVNVVPLCEQEQEIMMGHITMRLSSCVSIILSSTKTDLLFLNVET